MMALSLAMTGPALAQDEENGNSFEFQIGNWDYEIEGTVSDDSGRSFDTEDDLNLGGDTDLFLRTAFNNGVGWWPSIGFNATRIFLDGTSEFTDTTNFLFIPITSSATVTTEIDVDDFELMLFYPLPIFQETGLKLELGLIAKQLDGEITVRNRDTNETQRRDIDTTFPMVYGSIAYPLLDWLWLEVEGSGISNGDDTASEFRATVDWRPAPWFSVAGGWWQKSYDVDETDVGLDVDLDGPFLSVGVTL